jgi:hypothetical protein
MTFCSSAISAFSSRPRCRVSVFVRPGQKHTEIKKEIVCGSLLTKGKPVSGLNVRGQKLKNMKRSKEFVERTFYRQTMTKQML